MTFVLPFNIASSGTLQLLTGTPTASNTPANPTLFAPVSSTISTGSTFNYNAPAVSVSVITLTIASGTASTTAPTTTTGTASGAVQTHFGQCGG